MVLLALGTAARLLGFFVNRDYWLDEASLARAIRNARLLDVFGPISSSQLAPVGFMAVEARSIGSWATRADVAGLAAAGRADIALAFPRSGRAPFEPCAALLALAMFAISDDLIGFTAELKPYATDVAFALLCTRLALSWEPLPWPTVWLAVAGTVAAWFSFPATFVLSGVGLVLAGSAIARRDWHALRLLGLVAWIWGASVAGVQWAVRTQLEDPHAMEVFWNFSFPDRPLSPIHLADWTARSLSYFFANPMDLYIPGVGWTIPALVGLGLFLLGSLLMAGRDARTFGLLVTPLALTLLAGSLRLYPCHGRLVLFLVPALILLIAEGADRAAELIGGRAAWRLAFIWLALLPASFALFHLTEPQASPSAIIMETAGPSGSSRGNSYGETRPVYAGGLQGRKHGRGRRAEGRRAEEHRLRLTLGLAFPSRSVSGLLPFRTFALLGSELPSMPEQELLRVDQHPAEVLDGLAAVVGGGRGA